MHGMHGLKEVDFIGTPEAMKEKMGARVEGYKHRVAEYKKKRKHMRAEAMKRIKSVQVQYL